MDGQSNDYPTVNAFVILLAAKLEMTLTTQELRENNIMVLQWNVSNTALRIKATKVIGDIYQHFW